MMAGLRTTNRAMFWRILRRLFGANRGRLFVMLLALGAGSAVTAALLNLQIDAKRRLTKEFRTFGANVLIAPRTQRAASETFLTLDEAHSTGALDVLNRSSGSAVSYLYLLGNLHALTSNKRIPVVIAGRRALPLVGERTTHASSAQTASPSPEVTCSIGYQVAQQVNLRPGDHISISHQERKADCRVEMITSAGSGEDSQVAVGLEVAQQLAGLPGRISLVQLSVGGKPDEIEDAILALTLRLPDAEVRPIRQFTEGEAKIYDRISGLLTATVAIVLVLTGLCVMAAMTNVAMERKMDVGLMKAIGGSMRRVLRLFLAEAALLGLAGGMIGAAAGIFLSIGLGKAVFGVAARPRLIVYPVAVVLTIIVAIISAYPLRRLASIRPASVFRGEA
jgi:putative ABC transport system permease protein